MKLKIWFDDIYTWVGYFGSWFTSEERHLPIGHVRCVRGVLFQVTYQHGSYWKPETTWTPTDNTLNTMENVRRFRNRLVDGDNEIKLEATK